jgi:hypothetical protein
LWDPKAISQTAIGGHIYWSKSKLLQLSSDLKLFWNYFGDHKLIKKTLGSNTASLTSFQQGSTLLCPLS